MDSYTSKPELAYSVHLWSWEKKTKPKRQLSISITLEIRTEDAPLARNLFPEIIMRDICGTEYGQDWWLFHCHFTVQLENKAILKTAAKFYGLLIFFFYVVYFYGQDNFSLSEKLMNSPKVTSSYIIDIDWQCTENFSIICITNNIY